MHLRHAVLLSLAGHAAVLGGGWLGRGVPPSSPPEQVLTVRLQVGPGIAATNPQPAPSHPAPPAGRHPPVPARSASPKSAPQNTAAPVTAAARRHSDTARPVEAAVMPSSPVRAAEEQARAEAASGANLSAPDHGAAGGVDVAPSWPGYLANPAPEMPLASRQRGEVGKVVLKVRVDQSGRPQAVSVLHTSGFARLDEAARKTVAERWRFAPARRGDTPVDADVNVPIVFRLDD